MPLIDWLNMLRLFAINYYCLMPLWVCGVRFLDGRLEDFQHKTRAIHFVFFFDRNINCFDEGGTVFFA